MIFSGRSRFAFFVLSPLFFLISLSGCAGLGGSSGGPGAGFVEGDGGQPVQGVDLTWSDIGIEDAAGNPIGTPVVGQPVKIYSESSNIGNTAVESIMREFTIRGAESRTRRSSLDRSLAPGQAERFSLDYTFINDGPHTLSFEIIDSSPGRAADAIGVNPRTLVINVLPAGANPPGGGGGGAQTQGVDLGWSDVEMTDAAGNAVSEPVVGVPVNLIAMSTNTGNAAAQNIARFLSIDGHGISHDSVAQCDPGQSVPFVANNQTFNQAGPHGISLSMASFAPPQAPSARGVLLATFTINVREGLRPVVGASGTVNTDESHDLEFGEISYWQDGAARDPYVHQGHDQSAVYPGTEGEIRGNIKNPSSYNESDVRVSVKVNGRSIPGGEITLGRVPANGTGSFSIRYSFPGHGSYRISCDIDPQSGVRETNEGNNHGEGIVNVTNPLLTGNDRDLFCFNVQFEESNPVPYPTTRTTVGVPGALVGTFYNVDRSPVNAAATLLVDNQPVVPARPVTNTGGQAIIRQEHYSFTTPGFHKIKLLVAPLPGAQDSYQSNNSVERDIEVIASGPPLGTPAFRPVGLPRLAGPVTAAPPALAMTSTGEPDCELVAEDVALWVAGQDHKVGHVTVGQRGWVSYTVKNKKGAAVNDVNSEVRFLLDGQVVETIPAKLNVPANGKASGKADFTPFTNPGVYKMALVVDPSEQKKDRRRNNNTLTRSIRVKAARGPVVAASPGTDAGRAVVKAPVCELVAEGVEFWVPGVDHPVTRVMVGQRGWVRYTVKNKKGKAVADVHSEVRFLLNGQVMQIVPAGLDIPSEGQKTGKNDVAPFTVPGMYKMALMVDPLNAKKDNHRGDNVLTLSLEVDAPRQSSPAKASQTSGTLIDVFPGLLDTVLGGKGNDKPSGDSGYNPPPSAPAEQTPPPAQPPAKSPRKFTTSYQS